VTRVVRRYPAGTGTDGAATLPDGMALAYEAALQLGRSGAVEELMVGGVVWGWVVSKTLSSNPKSEIRNPKP
jgi:hypothetical protein